MNTNEVEGLIADAHFLTIYGGINVESPSPKILTEELRVKCIQELSKSNTFLSDTTINAFCVSDYRALY